MALGIAKAKPKYTPPKVCKKKQGTTVLLPGWEFPHCPDFTHGTLQCWLPWEIGGLTRPALFIFVMQQDNLDSCHYLGGSLNHGGNLTAELRFDIIAGSTELELDWFYHALAFIYQVGYTKIDFGSMQPLHWGPVPGVGFNARNVAQARFTFLS